MCWSSTVPEYDEGEELDRSLGVVGLEEEDGDYKEGGEDGRKKTCLTMR